MPFIPHGRCPAGVRIPLLTASIVAAFVAAGCSAPKPTGYALEQFDTVSSYARRFGVAAGQTCEAARRALLSHGYLVQRFSAELVDGRKSFQPSPDVHVEIDFHVVCAAVGPESSTLFVNALQDRYALKKTSGSASLGVGPLGSVSLPFWSSSDSMVKIASETILAADFYNRFFSLIEHQLAEADVDPADDPAQAILPGLVNMPASSGTVTVPVSSGLVNAPASPPLVTVPASTAPAPLSSPAPSPAPSLPAPATPATPAAPPTPPPASPTHSPREPTPDIGQPAAVPVQPN
jgi:hypothetical protein